MIRTYNQPPQWTVIFILLLSGLACSQFLIMGRTGSSLYLFLSVVPLLIFIFCAKPLLENRNITVGEEAVTIHDRFCKPKEMKITDLYQVVMNNGTVRSFRFKSKQHHLQFSPMGYIGGDELSEIILEQVKQKGIVVEIVPA